jgi:hypothetical protein
MGLRLLVFWDCGFEFCRGHGCLSLLSVVYCQVDFPASGWSLVQMSSTKCGVSEYDREASIMRRSWPTRCCCSTLKKIRNVYIGLQNSPLLLCSNKNYDLCESWHHLCVLTKIMTYVNVGNICVF